MTYQEIASMVESIGLPYAYYAGDQPQLIQGIRRRDGLGDFLYANQRCQE